MDSKLKVLFVEKLHERRRHRRLPAHLEPLLRAAVARRGLTVFFQPQFDVESGLGCGVEALARWSLLDGEEISPSVFIPIAERIEIIRPLGAWVLQSACETVSAWRGLEGRPPTLSVNVSTRQIGSSFCAVIENIINRTGFPVDRLELEITESALPVNAERAIECLESWRALGVHIAIDDFGTGYSSLSYLSRLPVDRLKLDRSFVRRMTFDKGTATIVRSVLALGRDMGIVVLAEGIETEREFEMLERLGCKQVQGFLFAKPVPAAEARSLLKLPWGARSTAAHPEAICGRGLHAA